MRVVQLENEHAASTAEMWGYHREIPADERELSKFFSFGNDCVWWLNKNIYCRDGELSVHICIKPRKRSGRLYGRKLLYAFEIVAEVMLAERLVVWLPSGSYVGDYLRRMGWSRAQDRDTENLAAWAKDLATGGEDHGWWADDGPTPTGTACERTTGA